MYRRFQFFHVCLLALSLLACTEPKTASDEFVSYIEVTPDISLLWQVGASKQLRATYKDADGVTINVQPQFAWTSSTPSVATVDGAGIVTAVADGQTTIYAEADGLKGEASIVINTGVLVIGGQIRYEDQIYSEAGPQGSAYKPARQIVVDLLDQNNSIIQSTSTDSQGNYQFGVSAGSGFSVRVISQSAPSTPTLIEINDLGGNLYAASKSVDVTNPASFNIDISQASGLAGAFNMLDVFIAASEMMATLTAKAQPPLAIYWEQGGGLGTYYCTGYEATYCPQNLGIYVLSSLSASGDRDEFDDDVLWHEYSHYVAQQMSKDDSPGGCHTLSSNDLDLRLAWSEGWGDFFPGAVKSWLKNHANASFNNVISTPVTTPVSIYVDTAGSIAQIALDMGAPGGAPFYYSSSEVAVANLLWQLSQQFGMAALWDVMESALPSATTPVNLESFWDGWLQRHTPNGTDMSTLNTILSSRQVFYTEDAYEADDAIGSARALALGVKETHHLYKASGATDEDFFQVAVTAGVTYRVETSNLKNGTDTYVRVLNNTGTQMIAENDDFNTNLYQGYDSVCGTTRVKNSPNGLASGVAFTPATTGIVYIQARTTTDPAPYPSAGRYGSYDLWVIQK